MSARPDFIVGAPLDAAYEMACSVHADEVRLKDGAPYVTHLVRAARLLNDLGAPETAVVAALLHDVVRYGDVDPAELETTFGTKVAQAIVAVTPPAGAAPYEVCKAHQRANVMRAGPDAAWVFAADRLIHLSDTRYSYQQDGEAHAAHLNAPFDVKQRTLRLDLEMLRRGFSMLPLLDGLAAELEGFAADRASARS